MSENPKNPLDKIPNIEEPSQEGRQLNAIEELAIIKSGYYSVRASLDLNFEQTVGQLYAQLLEKNQINSALTKEIAKLKKEIDEIKIKNPSQNP